MNGLYLSDSVVAMYHLNATIWICVTLNKMEYVLPK